MYFCHVILFMDDGGMYMNLSKQEEMMMLRELHDNMALFQRRYDYYENSSLEQLLNDVNELGIHMTVDDIACEYSKCFDTYDVACYFYDRDESLWDEIENPKQLINSDILGFIVSKYVSQNYDTEIIPDFYFIDKRMEIIDSWPKNMIQDKVLGIMTSIVEHGKLKQCRSLDEIFEMTDVNEFFKYYIKKCHNRDMHFKEVMKSYYDAFDDADRSIYKLK